MSNGFALFEAWEAQELARQISTGEKLKNGAVTYTKTDFLEPLKNLALFKQGSFTKGGITYEVAGNTVTLNGTASSDTFVYLTDKVDFLRNSGHFTLTALPSGSRNGGVNVSLNTSEANDVVYVASPNAGNNNVSATKDITNVGDWQEIFVLVKSGVTVTNYTLKIQIEKGQESTNFSNFALKLKYEEDLPGVNEDDYSNDYSQPFYKAEFVEPAKNLLYLKQGTFVENGITAKVEGNTVTLNGTSPSSGFNFFLSDKVNMLRNGGDFTLSGLSLTGNRSGSFNLMLNTSEQGSAIYTSIQSSTLPFKTTGTIADVGIWQEFFLYIRENVTFTDFKFKVQLERGTVNTKIEDFSLRFKYKELPYTSDKVELLMPNEVFVIEEEPLRLYKSSMISNYERRHEFDLAGRSYPTDELPYFDQAREKIDVDTTQLGSTLDLFLVDNSMESVTGKRIDVVSTSGASKSSATPNILMIGDSTTQGGLSTRVKQTLERYCSPTFIGSRTDNLGTPNEARGGWCAAQYVGYRTVDAYNAPLSSFPPFLKLADSDDKANFPEYCFTRTFVEKEKNYNEVTDKEQDFYIFDIDYLMSQISGQPFPDVFFISMGTNDLYQYRNESDGGVSAVKLSIKAMIERIQHSAPSAVIGVNPLPANGDPHIVNKNVQWIKECYALVDNYSGCKIVAEYAGQSKEFSWPASVSAISGRVDDRFVWTDTTHTNAHGHIEGAKPIAYFILNHI